MFCTDFLKNLKRFYCFNVNRLTFNFIADVTSLCEMFAWIIFAFLMNKINISQLCVKLSATCFFWPCKYANFSCFLHSWICMFPSVRSYAPTRVPVICAAVRRCVVTSAVTLLTILRCVQSAACPISLHFYVVTLQALTDLSFGVVC